MAASSSSNIPSVTSNDVGLTIINQKLQSLRETLDSILRIEQLISQGKSIDFNQRKILRSKHDVVNQLDELEQLSQTISSSLHNRQGHFKPNKNGTKETRSASFEPRDKSRYLCIFDGCVIYCLDLIKQSKVDALSNPQPLPKISTLDLLDKGLPLSMGLFKLGSEAYMIGGQHFPPIKKSRNHWGVNLFNFLYKEHGVKGSSCDVYRLSLLPNGSLSLSLSECSKIRPLNKPKVWPIVEKMNGQIHVIESFPRDFGYHRPDTIPSHEILNLSSNCDIDFDLDLRLYKHLVVGDRIYALAHGIAGQFGVFDSKTNKWELHAHKKRQNCYGWRSVKHVADVFGFGSGWGAPRGFRDGGSYSYVVFAVGEETYPLKKKVLVAYLVTPTGRVRFYQTVPDFFKGFKQDFTVQQGTLIDVVEGGNTMCLILQIKTTDEGRDELLFISTFTMKEGQGYSFDDDTSHDVVVDIDKLPDSENKEFVKLFVKQRYVYKREEYLGAEAGLGKRVEFFQACFL